MNVNSNHVTAEVQRSTLHTFSPCNDAARASPAQTLINMLKQKNGTRTAYASRIRAQICADNAPDQDKEVTWRDHSRPLIPLQHTLRYDGCRRHGGESGIVTSHIHTTTQQACIHSRSATWGSFCTPGRTIMDAKRNCKGQYLLLFGSRLNSI